MKKILVAAASMILLTMGMAIAEENVQISGDYQFGYHMLEGTTHSYVQADPTGANPAGFPMPGGDIKNDSLFTNRFGLNVKATPLEDISVKARMIMYKAWGHQTSAPINGQFFGDRAMGVNDGTSGHIPQDNTLRVDYAYTTWSNVGDMPLWFSVGRRPSTGGIPANLSENREKLGTAGIPAVMVDYAFDGMTLGFAPDIAFMPGAYAKLCYGKGFDSGYVATTGTTLKDTDFLGLNAALYDTDALHVEIQYQKGWNIFDVPSDGAAGFGIAKPTVNMGDIDWIGAVATGKINDLNLFISGAQSKTDPNGNTFGSNTSPWGLGYTGSKKSNSGTVIYLGGRYDITSSGTKIGLEYNQGSKDWIGMVPAAEDIWTSKLGTRGNVYEIYVIQELKNKALTKNAQAFFKLAYIAYDFEYSGSNNWIGAPVKISDLNTTNPMNQQMLTPVDKASDLYLTFDVRF